MSCLAGAEQKNWKCKRRGPERKEYCHIYRNGFKELKLEMDKAAPPTETPMQDFWRSPELRLPIHTAA